MTVIISTVECLIADKITYSAFEYGITSKLFTLKDGTTLGTTGFQHYQTYQLQNIEELIVFLESEQPQLGVLAHHEGQRLWFDGFDSDSKKNRVNKVSDGDPSFIGSYAETVRMVWNQKYQRDPSLLTQAAHHIHQLYGESDLPVDVLYNNSLIIPKGE
jgi:hypothetical protein